MHVLRRLVRVAVATAWVLLAACGSDAKDPDTGVSLDAQADTAVTDDAGNDAATLNDAAQSMDGSGATDAMLDAHEMDARGVDADDVDARVDANDVDARDVDAHDVDASEDASTLDANATMDATLDADDVQPDAASDAGCMSIEAEHLAPDVLIVLDRSGSMSSPIPTFPPNFISKWNIARDAINAMASEHEAVVRFGLAEFPTDADCAVSSSVRVPIDRFQAAEIASYFTTRTPDGNTPSHLGLQQALAHYQGLAINPAGRYVVFITDGEPNCSTDAAAAATATVAAVSALANADIQTFVIGFGGSFADDAVLDEAALAGGVARPNGPPHYYAANSAGQLNEALDLAIDSDVALCRYGLTSAPSDPDAAVVTINAGAIPRSTQHTNGWDYTNATTIQFYGTACALLSQAGPHLVDFEAACEP